MWSHTEVLAAGRRYGLPVPLVHPSASPGFASGSRLAAHGSRVSATLFSGTALVCP